MEIDWKEVIREIGMNNTQIAAIVKADHSTISRLRRGTRKEPHHALGERILGLLKTKRLEHQLQQQRGVPEA